MATIRCVFEAAHAATTPLRRFLLPTLAISLIAACNSTLEEPAPASEAKGPAPLGLEAEEVEPTAAFEVRDDAGASNGRVLVQTQGEGEDLTLPFNAPASGEHVLWARVHAPAADADATYLGFDGEPVRAYPDAHGRYAWVRITSTTLEADARHEITVRPGEPGLALDLFAVVAEGELDAPALERHFLGQDGDGDAADPGADDGAADDGAGDDGAGGDAPSDGDGGSDGSGENDDSDGSKDGDAGDEAPDAVRFGTLRGAPGFSPDDLSEAARRDYERLWAAIDNPDAHPDPDEMARDDDLYTYGRDLHTYLQTLLTVFRLTGDLRLLDEVDRLAEIMRDELRDAWRDTLDGSDGTTDGYLNWVHRYDGGDEYIGKDVHETNEIKVHAIVATLAVALERNRDLASPAGRDYGAHADFWREYLTEHFEPKWREREDVEEGFPYVYRPHTHTYLSSIKYYYYMHRLTGEAGYLEEAEREADIFWDEELRPVDSDLGPAYVWARSILSEGGSGDYLHPTTYARYTYNDFVEFHLEGFHRWANDGELERFARTFADFVIDRDGADDDDWFARDVGGGEDRAGLDSDDWTRMDVNKYARSAYAMIASWDESGRTRAITLDALEERGEVEQPKTVPLAAGLFLDTYRQP